MSKQRSAWREPWEEIPDIDEWLKEWNFDLTKPYETKTDKDGWVWYFQDEALDDKSVEDELTREVREAEEEVQRRLRSA